MEIIPVESADGSFFLRRNGKVILLLARGGGPLPILPEWQPDRVLTGPSGVSVLRTRHVSGNTAIWFLDEDFRYVTNAVDELSATARSALTEALPAFPAIDWEPASSGSDAPPRIASPAARANSSDAIASIELAGVRLFNPIAPEHLASLTDFWKENDYVVVPNALTEDAVRLLETRITFEQLRALDDPRQFHRVHNDDVCREFSNEFLMASRPFYEALLGLDLLPTYGFAMKYIKNSDMDPHYDNLHNPISSTVCYHFTPHGASNPLLLDKARFANPYTQRMTVADKDGIPECNVVRMDLAPGDLAAFRGRNHLHWREAIAGEMDYRALLLHFSDFKFKNTLVKGRAIPHVIDSLVDIHSYHEFREIYAMYFEQNGRDWS